MDVHRVAVPANAVDSGARDAAEELPRGPRTPMALQSMVYGLDPYRFFGAAHRRFGDVFTVRVMGERWVVIADPADARELLAHPRTDLDSGVARRSLRPIIGTRNVLLLDGDEHLRRRRRRLVLPPFHGESLRRYVELISELADRELGGGWLPFGGGVRRCVGSALAEIEGTMCSRG